jgi:hypothetical protein
MASTATLATAAAAANKKPVQSGKKVKVVLRARPLLPHESKFMSSVVVVAPNAIELRTPSSTPGSDVLKFSYVVCTSQLVRVPPDF